MSERLSTRSGKAGEKPTDVAERTDVRVNNGIIVRDRSTFINTGRLTVGGHKHEGRELGQYSERVYSTTKESPYEQNEDPLVGGSESEELEKEDEETSQEAFLETPLAPEDQPDEAIEKKKSEAITALYGDSFEGEDHGRVFDKLGLNLAAVDGVLEALKTIGAQLAEAEEKARRLEDDQSPEAEALRKEIQAGIEPALAVIQELHAKAEEMLQKYYEDEAKDEDDEEEVATPEAPEGDYEATITTALKDAKDLAASAHGTNDTIIRTPESPAVVEDRDSTALDEGTAKTSPVRSTPNEPSKRRGWFARRRQKGLTSQATTQEK